MAGLAKEFVAKTTVALGIPLTLLPLGAGQAPVGAGFDPVIFGLRVRRATRLLHPASLWARLLKPLAGVLPGLMVFYVQ
jgi:hypothetical protein